MGKGSVKSMGRIPIPITPLRAHGPFNELPPFPYANPDNVFNPQDYLVQLNPPFDYRKLIYHIGDTPYKPNLDREIEKEFQRADELQANIEANLKECHEILTRLGF